MKQWYALYVLLCSILYNMIVYNNKNRGMIGIEIDV